MDDSLTSVAVIEKDNNGDVLLTWTYPKLSAELGAVALGRSGLQKEGGEVEGWTWSRYKGVWLYILARSNSNAAGDATRRISAFSIVLTTTSFHPEKYHALASLLANTFDATGAPVAVLAKYLAAMAGFLPQTEFDPAAFTPAAAYLATPLREVVGTVEAGAVVLWAALLTKKRIFVYSDKVSPLLRFIRALPLLVWHRQDWSILRPYVNTSEAEINELKESAIYVAGFTDPAVKRMVSQYDVFVNLPDKEVIVAEHAQEDFSGTSPLHKDLTAFLLGALENPALTDPNIVKQISLKTGSLLQKLDALKETGENGESYITIDTLQQQGLPPGMDRFLFSVAAAEGLAKSL